jgi:hypothetical protein
MITKLLSRKAAAAMALSLSLAALTTACTERASAGDRMDAKPASAAMAQAGDVARTNQFAGPKANQGYATLRTVDGKRILTWSDDFKIPDTPAPHWQVVDSSGNTYLLKRLVIKGDKQNRSVEVPSYIKDVSKVQIWCAYAEVVLGEASFASPVAMK